MRAVTWQGPRRVETQDVPDPSLAEDTDAIVQVSATAICGSDLHLYEVLAPYLTRGDILGHEAMGTVVEAGGAVTRVRPGDCVVIPFNIACGACWMCARGLQSQCEVTQVRAQGKGAALFGDPVVAGMLGVVSRLPKPVSVPLAENAAVDRLSALRAAFGSVRRGGTVSIAGVYGGAVNPINMMELFDKQLTLRMGQANVRRCSDELLQMIEADADDFDTEHLATHRLPLDEAAQGYDMFQRRTSR